MLQGILSFLPYRNIALVTPVFLVLLYRILKPIGMTYGLLHNPYMDGVITGRTVPVFADANGNREGKEAIADREICVLIIAARSNHPLGLLAPGYKEVGDFFRAMIKDLDANKEEHGLLGASQWMSANDRAVGSEIMSVLYFESSEHLHNFAHGGIHAEAMIWWKNGYENYGHIGIMHEIYAVPKHSWEGVYINYHPTGLIATTTSAVIKDEQGERKAYISPMVRGKGQLRYSVGRMNRTIPHGEEKMLDGWLPEDGTKTV